MKKNNVLKTIMTILTTALITFSVTYLWLYGRKENNGSTESTIGNAFLSDSLTTKLQSIRDKIEQEYIGEIDENKLKEYAVKGYVAGLNDTYSAYYTAEEMEEFTSDTLGSYVGIGV